MIKHIIFDFDGVILESNDVKIDGFYKLFQEYGDDKARKISEYFANNAGFSRYDIIEYFFSNILKQQVEDNTLVMYAKKYSDIVKDEVVKSKYVIGCKEFLEENELYDFYVVSSSSEDDLKYICKKLNIEKYFKDILGSPTKKAVNIKNIIAKYNLPKSEAVYIGDSFNDYRATMKNNITFIARNSGVYDFSAIKGLLIVNDLTDINIKIKELEC